MKRGTPEHFKTMRLAHLLSAERYCDRAEALGLLEALCNHFAPRSAPQGNVGRCTNREIADGCHSTRDPDTLVSALVQSGWLDEHTEHRLLIHDWEQHADESVRKWLLRNRLKWLTPSGPRPVRVRTPSRRRLDRVDPPRAGNGNGNGLEVLENGKRTKVLRARVATAWPEDFVLTEERRAYAAAGGLNAEFQWAKFRDRNRAKGGRYVDWDAAWRNWCRNAVEWAGERRHG